MTLKFVDHRALPLPATNQTTQFLCGDFTGKGASDLVVLHKIGTDSGRVEADIFSGASEWQSHVGHLVTGVLCHPNKFLLGYCTAPSAGPPGMPVSAPQLERVPDLIMLSQKDTGTGTTEAHVLSGHSGWKSFAVQTPTKLHETDETYHFVMGDVNGDSFSDLVCLTRAGQHLDIHVLSGKSTFQDWLFHAKVPFQSPVGERASFLMPLISKYARPSLCAVKYAGTESGKLEIVLFNSDNQFRIPGPTLRTEMHTCDRNYEFLLSGIDWPRLEIIKKQGTGSGSTERHALEAMPIRFSGEAVFGKPLTRDEQRAALLAPDISVYDHEGRLRRGLRTIAKHYGPSHPFGIPMLAAGESLFGARADAPLSAQELRAFRDEQFQDNLILIPWLGAATYSGATLGYAFFAGEAAKQGALLGTVGGPAGMCLGAAVGAIVGLSVAYVIFEAREGACHRI